MRRTCAVLGLSLAVALAATLARGTLESRPLALADAAEPAAWQANPAEGVEVRFGSDTGPGGAGRALRVDFDFHGRSGWAAFSHPFPRAEPLALPENWEIRFRLRAEAPANDLEFKLVDPSGENVWWSVARGYEFPRDWTTFRVRRRQVKFAWGPAGGGEPGPVGALELAVTASGIGGGGRGSLWLADFELVPLPPEAPYAGTPVATATEASPDGPAAAAMDGNRATAWRARGDGASLTVDFGALREFSALHLHWLPGAVPTAFTVEGSEDGESWRALRSVRHGGAERSDLYLSESAARTLRVRIDRAPSGVALAELEVDEVGAVASPNDFFAGVAARAPHGAYPRSFSGEQLFWTVVGVDRADEEALVSEDGAVELGERGFSIEPFVRSGGRLLGWAGATTTRSLAGGDLPIPTVVRHHDGFELAITALASGPVETSRVDVAYELRATGTAPVVGELLLAARPFQVNPPTQFLNVRGGVAPIRAIACDGGGLAVDGRARLATKPAPDACGVQAFDEGGLVERLAAGAMPSANEVSDAFPYASGALAFRFALAPGASKTVVLRAPLASSDVPASPPTPAAFATLLDEESRRWNAALTDVAFELPPEGARLAALARSSLAWVLVHRDGAALQPGSRSYARSWIRDGALTGAALLRLGRADVARDFADWYAPYQFADGRVPCCVDRRGADPVPEHDSHGELVHLVREVFRFTGDRAFAERHWPRVEAAADAIVRLAGERRTDFWRAPERREFYGLLPPSISHEGYSAKAMHSYWDDAFGYRGLADAAALAADLGRAEAAARFGAEATRFRSDLVASIAASRARHGIDFVPGSADLGDFDATSTTILLEPGGLGEALPRAALEATFERYRREVAARASGSWDAYTPYELRSVGAFVRLGWREPARALVETLLGGLRPDEWNQWPEVSTRAIREPRFLGDLPHAWVATDFVRSFLDLFAYEAREREALIVAAGVPEEWLAADGAVVAVNGLRTPWGALSLRLRRDGDRLIVDIGALDRMPPGGVELRPPTFSGNSGAAGVRRSDGGSVVESPSGTFRLATLPARLELEVRR